MTDAFSSVARWWIAGAIVALVLTGIALVVNWWPERNVLRRHFDDDGMPRR